MRLAIVDHRWPRRSAAGLAIPFPIAVETTRDWKKYFLAVLDGRR